MFQKTFKILCFVSAISGLAACGPTNPPEPRWVSDTFQDFNGRTLRNEDGSDHYVTPPLTLYLERKSHEKATRQLSLRDFKRQLPWPLRDADLRQLDRLIAKRVQLIVSAPITVEEIPADPETKAGPKLRITPNGPLTYQLGRRTRDALLAEPKLAGLVRALDVHVQEKSREVLLSFEFNGTYTLRGRELIIEGKYPEECQARYMRLHRR